jgi:glycosyltransferase involved in cell wall biosynthesis
MHNIATQRPHQNRRPRIAIIADVRGWAFHNIACSIQKGLNDKYDIDIFYIEDFTDYLSMFLCLIGEHFYDLIHCLWRESASAVDILHAVRHIEKSEDNFAFGTNSKLNHIHITVSVYDHLLSDIDSIKVRNWTYNNLYSGYTVSSSKLYQIYDNYSKLINFPKPLALVEDGVDLSKFNPSKLDRLIQAKPLVVGWVGNSKWGADGLSDPKGFNSILKPAIGMLQNEGLEIVGNYADKQVRFIPHAEMPSYYENIDVLVCASETEGTPNPILEAMACGVPFISTDVGIVRELAGPKQSDFILSDRSVESLAFFLRKLVENRILLSELSNENLARIHLFTREREAAKWDVFFTKILSTPSKSFINNDALVMMKDFLYSIKRQHDIQTEGLRDWIRSNEQMIEDLRDCIRSNEQMIDERDVLLRDYSIKIKLLSAKKIKRWKKLFGFIRRKKS